MNIGENIKKRRKELGLSQKELSKRSSLKQPTISAIENGDNKPAFETILLLSDALGCTVSELIGQSQIQEKESELSNEELALIFMFRQLNVDGKQLLMDSAESFISRPSLREERSAKLVE